MKADDFAVSPPQQLAIAYARKDIRLAFGLLLAFDDRIAGVVGRGSEPIFAQMKIAWWQEALAKPAHLRPKGEPLFAELRQLENAGRAEGLIGAMQLVLDAWGILAAHEEWSHDQVKAFAETRSNAAFGTYAGWVATFSPNAEQGQRWAIDDLSSRFGKQFGVGNGAPPNHMHRRLRPLSILAHSVRPDISGTRLIWHALTGR